MANVSLTAPTDYGLEATSIERRRKLADILQQQSLQPQESQTAGGWTIPTPWTQHAAKLGQALFGAMGQQSATQQQMALVKAMRGDAQNYLGSVPQGTPASDRLGGDPMVADDQMNVHTPAQPPSSQASMNWAMQGAMSGNPYTQSLANMLLPHLLKGAEPFSLREGEIRLGPNGEQIAANPKQHPLHFANTGGAIQPMNPMTGAPQGPATPTSMTPGQQDTHDENQGWSEPYELGGAMVRKNSVTGKVEQVVSRPPQTTIHNPAPVTAVTIQDPDNPNGTIIIDGRTRQVLGKGPKLTQTGTAEQKLSLNLPQAKQRVESITQNLDRLDAAITSLHDDPGLSHITGTIAGRTPNLTNKATGAQGQLNSIKSQIFQSSLQAMREASKTGGAVGNVSDREGDKLERTIVALDQAMGTPDFQKQLKLAQEQLRRSKEIIRTAFDEQFGGVQSDAPQNGLPPPRADVPRQPSAPTPQRRSTDRVRRYNPATGGIE